MESNLENKAALKKATFLAATVNTAPHFLNESENRFPFPELTDLFDCSYPHSGGPLNAWLSLEIETREKGVQNGSQLRLSFCLQIAVEAISNIRTVAALGREDTFCKIYNDELSAPHRASKRRASIRGKKIL
jgi:hypothetical protein